MTVLTTTAVLGFPDVLVVDAEVVRALEVVADADELFEIRPVEAGVVVRTAGPVVMGGMAVK